MDTVAIPEWNPSGVMPPIQSTAPTAMERSPYPVSLTDFVLRFSTTNKCRAILSGLLGFRAALHSAGLTEGFQWIDGSFIENIEEIESREPADVDVVTFFHLPR
ncbi:MAG: hypothetical protein H3C30_07875 [Candidatus Hydrogenedentes bacterium]|nr:hypothetical protein [Candidatus Hydrogenedentota bacterium]